MKSIVFVLFLIVFSFVPAVYATDSTGRDLTFVPIAWCIVDHSPVLDESIAIEGKTQLVDKMWNRHERASERVYIPQAEITFRGHIDGLATEQQFQKINDYPFSSAPDGFMRVNQDSDDWSESLILRSWCIDAFDNVGYTVNGIMALNVKGITDYSIDGTIMGIGACSVDETDEDISLDCSEPYEGIVWVVDNYYTHPTSPIANNDEFIVRDDFDQNLAHEMGHALGLRHMQSERNNNELMHAPATTEGGTIQNHDLTDQDISDISETIEMIDGAYFDPPNVIEFTDYSAVRIPDSMLDEAKIPESAPFMDLTSAKITINSNKGITYFTQSLAELIPSDEKFEHVIFLDYDKNPSTGAVNSHNLEDEGIPSLPFNGVDFIMLISVNDLSAESTMWMYQDEKFVKVPEQYHWAKIQKLVGTIDYYVESTNTVEGESIESTIRSQ